MSLPSPPCIPGGRRFRPPHPSPELRAVQPPGPPLPSPLQGKGQAHRLPSPLSSPQTRSPAVLPQGAFDPAQAPLQKVIKRKHRQGEERIALGQNKAKHCHRTGPLALPQGLQGTSGGGVGAGGRQAGGRGLRPGFCNPLGCRAQLHSCPGPGQAPRSLGRATLQVQGPCGHLTQSRPRRKGLPRSLRFPTAHREAERGPVGSPSPAPTPQAESH